MLLPKMTKEKQYRVKRFRWKRGEVVLDKVMFLNHNTYTEALKSKQPPKGYSNAWFEDYPVKWYEFYWLRKWWKRISTVNNTANHNAPKTILQQIIIKSLHWMWKNFWIIIIAIIIAALTKMLGLN